MTHIFYLHISNEMSFCLKIDIYLLKIDIYLYISMCIFNKLEKIRKKIEISGLLKFAIDLHYSQGNQS